MPIIGSITNLRYVAAAVVADAAAVAASVVFAVLSFGVHYCVPL